MATTTLTFGPGYNNGRGTIWSIRRQVVTLPLNTDTSSFFKTPNRPISSSTSITLPLRSGQYIPSNKTYNNLKVVIFKGFNNSYIDNGTSKTNWFVFNDVHYGLAKETSDEEYWFDKIHANTLMTTPLAYFSGSVTVNTSAEDVTATFTNPTFTEAGKSLANWYVSTTDDNYARNRLYVGIYHDSDTVWTDASGNEATLNWTYPTLDNGTTLTLGYGESGTVRYYTGTEWKTCEVYYHNGSNWIPCEVNYYDNGWKPIG